MQYSSTVLCICKDDDDGESVISNKIGEIFQEATALDFRKYSNNQFPQPKTASPVG